MKTSNYHNINNNNNNICIYVARPQSKSKVLKRNETKLN